MPQALRLLQFGNDLRAAFGEMAYHVGSSLREKSGWRDVDVRLMLDDAEWDAQGLGDPDHVHSNAKWRAITLAWSAYGQVLTGLPIDFQLQKQSHANAQYSQREGHPRSALFEVTESPAAPPPVPEIEIFEDEPVAEPPVDAASLCAHGHVWPNDGGDDWYPDEDVPCACGQRVWRGGRNGFGYPSPAPPK